LEFKGRLNIPQRNVAVNTAGNITKLSYMDGVRNNSCIDSSIAVFPRRMLEFRKIPPLCLLYISWT